MPEIEAIKIQRASEREREEDGTEKETYLEGENLSERERETE